MHARWQSCTPFARIELLGAIWLSRSEALVIQRSEAVESSAGRREHRDRDARLPKFAAEAFHKPFRDQSGNTAQEALVTLSA